MSAIYWLRTPAHDYLVVPLDTYPDAHGDAESSPIANGCAFLEGHCDAPAFLARHPEIDVDTLAEKSGAPPQPCALGLGWHITDVDLERVVTDWDQGSGGTR